MAPAHSRGTPVADRNDRKAGKTKTKEEIWAIALSGEGRYLAGTSGAGGVSVWDLDTAPPPRKKVAEWGPGKQGWGMCVDFVSPSVLDLIRSLRISKAWATAAGPPTSLSRIAVSAGLIIIIR